MASAGLRGLAVLAALLAGPAPRAQNYSDLWWNPAEPGWGLAIADHETQLFAVWFTYDAAGNATWFACPGGSFGPGRRAFTGPLYATTGPFHGAASFDPARVGVTRVGTLELDFAPAPFASGIARFSYSVGDLTRSREVRRQSFGRASANWGRDHTDLWWNPAESGWGLSVVQHADNAFVTWFTYDAQGRPTFFVVPSVEFAGPNAIAGRLYSVTGPSYLEPVFDPARVRVVEAGRASLAFAGNAATFATTMADGPRSRAVERQGFGRAAADGRGTVTVIDSPSLATETLPGGGEPSAIAGDPGGHRIFVANNAGNSVSVIDTATFATRTIEDIPAPTALAFDPPSDRLYVLSREAHRISVVDATTFAVATIAAGREPRAIAVDPVSGRAYVANFGSDDVTVLERGGSVLATVPSGTQPYAIAVNAATRQVYVANYGSDDVTVIDGRDFSTARVRTGSGPSVVAVDARTNRIYVANLTGRSVTVIDGASRATTTVPTGDFPHALGIDPVTGRVYVANYRAGSVTVIGADANAVATLGAGDHPRAIAVDADARRAYVANEGSSSLTVIDMDTHAVRSVAAGPVPFALVLEPGTGRVYVANRTVATFPPP